MKPSQIKASRLTLQLTQAQLGEVMDCGKTTVARFEQGLRLPPARFIRLLNAYLSGYRPDDWPTLVSPRREQVDG